MKFWLFVSQALAQTTQQAAAPAAQTAATAPPAYMNMIPIVVTIAVFYFLLIRPQAKRAKQQQGFLTALKRGDAVLTSGGLMGTIEGITEQFVTLEIAAGVRVKMLKSQIASLVSTEVGSGVKS